MAEEKQNQTIEPLEADLGDGKKDEQDKNVLDLDEGKEQDLKSPADKETDSLNVLEDFGREEKEEAPKSKDGEVVDSSGEQKEDKKEKEPIKEEKEPEVVDSEPEENTKEPSKSEINWDEENKSFVQELGQRPKQAVIKVLKEAIRRDPEIMKDIFAGNMHFQREYQKRYTAHVQKTRNEFMGKYSDAKELWNDMRKEFEGMGNREKANLDLNSAAGLDALYWRVKAAKNKITAPKAHLASAPSGSAGGGKIKSLSARQKEVARKAGMTEEQYLRYLD